MLVEVKKVCAQVVCHRRLGHFSAPQPSLGGSGRCWPTVCWGLDILETSASSAAAAQSLPSRRLRGCHNLWSPGTTEALPAPSQADSRVRVSQGADGRTKEGCRLTLAGTPGSRRNIRIQVSAFLILFNRIQTVSGEIFFPLPDRFWVMAQSCPSFFYRKYFPKYFFLSHKITFITDFYLGLINIFIKLKVIEKLYFLFFFFFFWRVVVGLCHTA